MSFPVFFQIFTSVVFAVGFIVVFARLRRPAKDDPRLSKGLQLLSSKIAVLEDLSDRTEHQVQQMLTLLDQKSKELQSKIALADQQVMAVRQSMEQSLEVAQIFQDKIPHNEIIERQNSVKYIKAARLAHAGMSVADIAKEVDLPLGEIEFIAKVNQESLSFREEDLPAWARDPQDASNVDHLSMAASMTPQVQEHMPMPATGTQNGSASPASIPNLSPEQEGLVQRLSKLQFEMKNLDLELAHRSARNVMPDTTQAFESPRLDSTSLERLGEEFRRAVEAAEQEALNEAKVANQSGFHWSASLPGAQDFESALTDASTAMPETMASLPQAAQVHAPATSRVEMPAPPAHFANQAASAPVAAHFANQPPVVHSGAHFAPLKPQPISQSPATSRAESPPTSRAESPPTAGAPAPQATLAREVSIPELEAARAAAAALRGKEPVPAAKVIRRVEFPRI